MVDAPKYANATFTYAPTTTTDHAMLKYKSKKENKSKIEKIEKIEKTKREKEKEKTNNLRHRMFSGCQ